MTEEKRLRASYLSNPEELKKYCVEIIKVDERFLLNTSSKDLLNDSNFVSYKKKHSFIYLDIDAIEEEYKNTVVRMMIDGANFESEFIDNNFAIYVDKNIDIEVMKELFAKE